MSSCFYAHILRKAKHQHGTNKTHQLPAKCINTRANKTSEINKATVIKSKKIVPYTFVQ